MRQTTLSAFWWLYVPGAIILGQIALELSFDHATLAPLHSEGGPHETLQSVFIGAAFVYALYLLTRVNWTTQKMLGGVLALAALGSLYISGEEISWGQHILHWNTPSYWAHLNDQDETNLHNTSAWLDQKPRLLLFAGIVVAGLIVPALRRWKPDTLPPKFFELYPSDSLVITALGVLVPYTIQEITEQLWRGGAFTRVSEVQELYIYYFILLYLMDLHKRVFSEAGVENK